jgi:hypothetical protein
MQILLPVADATVHRRNQSCKLDNATDPGEYTFSNRDLGLLAQQLGKVTLLFVRVGPNLQRNLWTVRVSSVRAYK